MLRCLVCTTGPRVHIWSDFAPKEALGNIWRHFWLLQLGQGCYWWVKARNAAQHPTMYKIVSPTEHDPAPCVNGAEYTVAQWSMFWALAFWQHPLWFQGVRIRHPVVLALA